jgi:ATP-dependent DNA helicase 2 subunit 2
MYEKNVMAIARWVTKDGMDPKMGVLSPIVFDEVDCLIWAQVCFVEVGGHHVELIRNLPDAVC